MSGNTIWVRTQYGDKIVLASMFYTENGFIYCDGIGNKQDRIMLGKYKNKEVCIKVLDKIRDRIQLSSRGNISPLFEMPEE